MIGVVVIAKGRRAARAAGPAPGEAPERAVTADAAEPPSKEDA
jgi:hypothetical protein